MKFSRNKFVAGASLAVSTIALLPSVVFAQNGGTGTGTTVSIGTIQGGPGWAENLGAVLTTVLSLVMGIAALAVFIYLIWGGIQWITSGGEKGKTEEARNKITSAVIGLIVLAAAYALLMLMLRILGFTSLNNALEGIRVIQTVPAGSTF